MASEVAKKLADHYSHNCFIVYFDFLGFSEIVKRNFHIDVVTAFTKAEEEIQSVLQSTKKIWYKNEIIYPAKNYFWFSDTLILYSKDHSSKN